MWVKLLCDLKALNHGVVRLWRLRKLAVRWSHRERRALGYQDRHFDAHSGERPHFSVRNPDAELVLLGEHELPRVGTGKHLPAHVEVFGDSLYVVLSRLH